MDWGEDLGWKKLAGQVEVRASATGHGWSPAELVRYNQELSKKRLDAVVNRLKRTIAEKDQSVVLDTTQMKAIGASRAPKFGVEDVYERLRHQHRRRGCKEGYQGDLYSRIRRYKHGRISKPYGTVTVPSGDMFLSAYPS